MKLEKTTYGCQAVFPRIVLSIQDRAFCILKFLNVSISLPDKENMKVTGAIEVCILNNM